MIPRWLVRLVIAAMLMAAVAVVVAVAAYVKQQHAVDRNRASIALIQREGAQRRDQTCRGWEQAHAVEVRDLEQSYEFYAAPPPQLRALLLSPVALASLAERVRNASRDRDPYGQFVPAYCDAAGVGAREPDPEIPKPPANVAGLLERLKQQTRPQP